MLIGTGVIMIFMMRRADSLAGELTGISAGGTGLKAGAAELVGTGAKAVGKALDLALRYGRSGRGNSGGRGGDGGSSDPRKVTGN